MFNRKKSFTSGIGIDCILTYTAELMGVREVTLPTGTRSGGASPGLTLAFMFAFHSNPVSADRCWLPT